MKAPARSFQLSDWYGEDWDPKKPIADGLWVSPWAKAHYKLRQLEIEIEQCELLMQYAIENEDYAEAGGLMERLERVRSQHPIRPREERLSEALKEQNFELAAVFQKDLDAVKRSLGLPKFNVGQAVRHAHREGLRGVIIDVDLQCTKSSSWIEEVGCLERGCALGYPATEVDRDSVVAWSKQAFYTVLVDLKDMQDEAADEDSKGKWRWHWPQELSAWKANILMDTPPPIYLSEDSICVSDDFEPVHPEMQQLFDGFDVAPYRGRTYRPTPRLRLWQQQRALELQQRRIKARASSAGSMNPYDRMK